tara:strand:- start:2898 stop:3137 length:240 start_codon:yes stop_codon:yes gene_type:complete
LQYTSPTLSVKLFGKWTSGTISNERFDTHHFVVVMVAMVVINPVDSEFATAESPIPDRQNQASKATIEQPGEQHPAKQA